MELLRAAPFDDPLLRICYGRFWRLTIQTAIADAKFARTNDNALATLRTLSP